MATLHWAAVLLGFHVCDAWRMDSCVTWVEASQKGAVNSSWDALDQFIPAIYSAWQWKPGPFVPPAAPTNGSCPPCDGKQGSFNCAYIFPCYSDEPGASGWGHRDTSVGGVPRISFLVSGCNTHLPDGNSSMANSRFWLVRSVHCRKQPLVVQAGS